MMDVLFDSKNILGNAVGLIAVLLGLGVYAYKSRKKILVTKLVVDILWATYYFLIGTSTGGVLNVINAVRDGVFYHKDSKKWASNSLWVIAFVSLNIISGIASWQGYISLFPIVGSSIAIIGLWYSDSHKLRVTSFVAISLWLVYGITGGAVIASVYNSFALISILVGLLRDIKEKRNNKKTGE